MWAYLKMSLALSSHNQQPLSFIKHTSTSARIWCSFLPPFRLYIEWILSFWSNKHFENNTAEHVFVSFKSILKPSKFILIVWKYYVVKIWISISLHSKMSSILCAYCSAAKCWLIFGKKNGEQFECFHGSVVFTQPFRQIFLVFLIPFNHTLYEKFAKERATSWQ